MGILFFDRIFVLKAARAMTTLTVCDSRIAFIAAGLVILVTGCYRDRTPKVVYGEQHDKEAGIAIALGSNDLAKAIDHLTPPEKSVVVSPGQLLNVVGTFVLAKDRPIPLVVCEINRRLPTGGMITANSEMKPGTKAKEGAAYDVPIKAPVQPGEYEIVVVADGQFAGRGTLTVKPK